MTCCDLYWCYINAGNHLLYCTCLSFVGWHHSCLPRWRMYAGYRHWPLSSAWSRDHTTNSVTIVLWLPGQRCGTVCLNSFVNRTSPSDDSNDHWQCLCLVSRAAVPYVWTLRVLTRNLTYLLTWHLCLFVCYWLDLCEKFTRNVSLDKEVTIKFWNL